MRNGRAGRIVPLLMGIGLGIVARPSGAQTPADSTVIEGRPTTHPHGDDTGGYVWSISAAQAPALKEWSENLNAVVTEWYPRIVQFLPSNGFAPPKKFTITFKKMKGVAYTSGTDIVGAEAWFVAHPDDQGAIVHELVHVVQQYHSAKNPGWLVEGVADYIRWFKYEPSAKRPHPNPAKAHYEDSYRTTAAFLEFVAAHYDHEIVVQMNAAMREGRYTPELWSFYTGKSPEDLWAEYVKTLN